MHSRERTSGLSIAAARSFLLSAAIGISVFLVRAYNHASIASGLCFARMSRVSLSLVHHHLHDIVMTSCDYFRRQRTSQPAIWRERLPLGTAEGAPGAVRLKIYACAHRYCCCCTSGHVGVARPRHGTNAGCLHFVWGWEARKQADWSTKKAHIYLRCFVFVLTFSQEYYDKLLRATLFEEKSLKLPRKFSLANISEMSLSIPSSGDFMKSVPHITQGFFLTDLERVTHSRFTPQPLLSISDPFFWALRAKWV